jgi:hypothetical protein
MYVLVLVNIYVADWCLPGYATSCLNYCNFLICSFSNGVLIGLIALLSKINLHKWVRPFLYTCTFADSHSRGAMEWASQFADSSMHHHTGKHIPRISVG